MLYSLQRNEIAWQKTLRPWSYREKRYYSEKETHAAPSENVYRQYFELFDISSKAREERPGDEVGCSTSKARENVKYAWNAPA